MRFTSELRARYEILSSTNVSDALDALGLRGATHGIRPLQESWRKLVGPAVTMRLTAAGIAQQKVHLGIRAIAAATEGDVIVIDNGGRMDTSCWGGILANAAKMKWCMNIFGLTPRVQNTGNSNRSGRDGGKAPCPLVGARRLVRKARKSRPVRVRAATRRTPLGWAGFFSLPPGRQKTARRRAVFSADWRSNPDQCGKSGHPHLPLARSAVQSHPSDSSSWGSLLCVNSISVYARAAAHVRDSCFWKNFCELQFSP